VPRAPASLAVQRARVPVASPIPTVSSAAGIASAPPQSTSVETVRPAASAATTVPARPYTTIVASGVARAAERRPEPAPARRDVAPPAAVSSSAGPDDFELGLYYQRTGNFEQALVHYQAVLARDELNLEAHNNLGRLYLEKGLPDDAIREFQRGVAIDPRYLKAHVNLAAAYFKLERYDMSAAESRAALAIDPRSVDALVNLALAQKASGQLADARESLLAALRIDQHNAAAHYNLARQYEDSGDAALARAHYESFLKYAGPDQTAYASDVRARIAALSARMK
ncbi:MAG TPA: tetratricopeptide repeat protein, partial [Vicinamibacterales bacterium]